MKFQFIELFKICRNVKMPSPGGRCPSAHTGADEGKTNTFYMKKPKKSTQRLTLISQKSKIFASFPQGKPFGTIL